MAKQQKEDKQEKELSKAEKIALQKKELEKKYGQGTLIGGNDKGMKVDVISTNSIGLDNALGIGGLPKGRIVEIYGTESSGKTTLCLELIAKAQETPDVYCAVVDAEHALSTTYCTQLGIDMNRLEISQPDYGEQALDIAETLIKSGLYDVVIIDSVAALTPISEIEGEMGKQTMGVQARMMNQALRKLTAITSKSKTCLIFINQLRDKIGVMFGNPETTTGGNGLKFYSTIRLDVRRSTTVANSVMEGDTKMGNQTTVKVIKNKLAPPFRQCTFNILYGEGIDVYGELLDLSLEWDVINKSGSWFSYKDSKIGQGREAVLQLLKDNEEFYKEVKEELLKSMKPKEFTPTEDDVKIQLAEETPVS